MSRPTRFAVIMDIAVSSFQEEPLKGILAYSAEKDVDIVCFGIGRISKDDPDDRAHELFLDFITPGEFDGAILVSSSLMNTGGVEVLKRTLKRLKGLPLASIGPSVLGEPSHLIDNTAGISKIMEHLIHDHGYRRFAFVSGPGTNEEAVERLAAYRAALDAAGIPHSEREEYEGTFLPPSGEAAVKAFLGERGLSPEVIVCANDFMAIGAWNAISARGLSVPLDIAVTGFDDLQVSHSLSNRFTTVSQPFDKLGYLATRRLHAMILGEDAGEETVVPELRIRSSCGCVNAERRKKGPYPFSPGEDSVAVRSLFLDSARTGFTEAKVDEVLKRWSGSLRTTLSSGLPVYEYEQLLRDLRTSANGFENRCDIEPVLTMMYSLMLEECGHAFFLDDWTDNFTASRLSTAIDELSGELNLDPALASTPMAFSRIASRCGAASFHFAIFNDADRPLAGARAIFSVFPDCARQEPWRPGPGSWIPERAGPLVANMLIVDEKPFGFFLVDARIRPLHVFETLRLRFNGIFRDFSIMKSVKTLNAGLMQEIAAREEAQRRLTEALSEVERLSIEDELSGLHNRRGFIALAQQQVKYLRREKQGYFILFLDLDGLKGINDGWGHKDGDLAIKSAGTALKRALRESDIVARLGGDEFSALVSNVVPEDIAAVKNRITGCFEKMNQELGKEWFLASSLGHCYAGPDEDISVETMLEIADVELYREKKEKKLRST